MNVILACDEKYGIGLNCGLPWNVPEDLRKFRELTMGNTGNTGYMTNIDNSHNVVIMGKNTFETFSKPLPGRKNIVVSKSLYESHIGEHVRGFHILPSLHEAIEFSKKFIKNNYDKIWIIGGAKIYASVFKEYVGFIKKIYLTKVKGDHVCDVYLSEDTIQYLERQNWDVVETTSSCQFLESTQESTQERNKDT